MNTWPISTRVVRQRVLLGIPPRLGDGSPGSRATWPSLEERAGEDWLEQVLRLILPRDRAWLWWTRNDVLSSAMLDSMDAPARIATNEVTTIMRKNLWLRQMSLVTIPPSDAAGQQKVLAWAGADTEQTPEHLWTASNEPVEWNVDDVTSWCLNPKLWRDPAQVVTRPAERVITLFDGYVFCALAPAAGARLRAELAAFASQWGLVVIAGAKQDAWIAGGG